VKKCPFCLEEIPDEAVKCQHCGKSVNKDAKRKRPQPGSLVDFISVFQIVVAAFIGFVICVIIILVHTHSHR